MPALSLRIGTRASPLARWQADYVAERLRALEFPGGGTVPDDYKVEVELVLISTQGDRNQVGPLGEIGGVGLFTREIQRALLDNRIDIAVHSLKDLPTDVVPGLVLAAVPPRESVRDALIGRNGETLDQLPRGARIGTGSARRRAQLLRLRDDLQLLDIRGNVDTRLRKLDEGEFDAIMLAEAGLKRLALDGRVSQFIGPPAMLPAVGQAALGIETRADDTATRAVLQYLDDAATHAAVVAERAMLAALRGGCLAPVGAWGRIEEGSADGTAPSTNAGPDSVRSGKLRLEGIVLSLDGKQAVQAEGTATSADAESLGQHVAQRLLDQGAAKLIESAR